MNRLLVTGNAAAAWGARLARIDYVPAFPITPQTEIIETLSAWIESGELDARMLTLESEHSMLTAAGAAAATGVRAFTATSSQGLLYGLEMIYAVAGWRAPFVLVNVSRGLATPVTLEPDHNDVLATRDTGFLQLHAATAQEVLDLTLLAYRVAEDEDVRLPAIVNLDGFYLSFTREPVSLPEPAEVDGFLPAFTSGGTGFRAVRPVGEAVAVLGGGPYSYFRYQTHAAARNALGVFEAAAVDFERRFGRRYAPVETYRSDDADVVFVMMGCFATKAKAAVDHLREAGHPVGLVRPRMLRPFPDEALRAALCGRRAAAVIDQNISMGFGGVLHGELAAGLCGVADAPVLASFIGGLGGRDIPPPELYAIAEAARAAADAGTPPAPRLLYTEAELREMRRLQGIAAAERAATPGERT
jgi:pyruvate ferredoxin oxidoreductase alpha subunit